MTRFGRHEQAVKFQINLGTIEPRPLKITKELAQAKLSTLVTLLIDYNDIYSWSNNDMKGLDPCYYQHKIQLKQIDQSRHQLLTAKQIEEDMVCRPHFKEAEESSRTWPAEDTIQRLRERIPEREDTKRK